MPKRCSSKSEGARKSKAQPGRASCDCGVINPETDLKPYPQRQVPPGELVDPVEHRVAASVETTALTGRVELAPGRERREQLVSVRVQALGVLIPLRGTGALALRHHPGGHATGDRRPPSVLEDGGQSEDLAGAHRRLRVMGSQVSVLCDSKGGFTRLARLARFK
jgi:hypothetical protein